jgi:hypothetical protein
MDPYHYAALRRGMMRNDPMQAVAGPLEHREFVQDVVSGGMLAAPAMAAAIPVYTGAKYLDERFRAVGGLSNPIAHTLYSIGKAKGMFGRARSPASWDEIFAGYEGLFSGLQDRLAKQPAQQPRVNYASAAGR